MTPQNNDREFIFLLLLATLLGLMFLASCTTKRYVVRQDSIMVTKTDTVTRSTVTKETVWRDRLRDRYVVVNALGDTVRDIRKEYVHIRDTVHDTVQIAATSSNERHTNRVTNTLQRTRSPTDFLTATFLCLIAVALLSFTIFFFCKTRHKT